MKRWLLVGLAIIIVVIIAFLGQPAVDPDDFTGEWYSVSGQQIYRFHHGIIHCEQYGAALADGRSISGAYVFSGKTVALFAMGVDGLETVKELYLIENREESLLCDKEEGNGTIYFVRYKKD